MKNLIDNFYEMVKNWEKFNSYGDPEIVLLCSPKFYYEDIRASKDFFAQYYIRSDFDNKIDFLSIMGIRVPTIISKDLGENVEYKLMFRKEYEEIEKEKLYHKFIKTFETFI